jgi:hypothetical protein
MRFKRKLTRAELQAIQGRNDFEDVNTLLWELLDCERLLCEPTSCRPV